MTEQTQIDFTTNKALRTLSVQAYKFNLYYGKELMAKNKVLNIYKAKVLVNSNGCFLIGRFLGISEFTFGEWDKDAAGDSKYNNNKGAFVANSDLTPKDSDVVCLFLPKNDKLDGYSGFEGLAKFLSSSPSGGKIEDSYLTLNLADYYSFVVDANGNPIDSDTARVLFNLGSKQNRFSISFASSDADFTSIDAVEIPDNFGGISKSGYGSGSKVEVHQETVEERVLARLKIFEERDTNARLHSAYLEIRESFADVEELYIGDLSFKDFLAIMLR